MLRRHLIHQWFDTEAMRRYKDAATFVLVFPRFLGEVRSLGFVDCVVDIFSMTFLSGGFKD